MNIHRTPVTAGMSLLALTLPLSLAAANPPDELHLTGIVRDFHASHSDMENQPGNGFGLYSGLVHHALGSDYRPVFTGSGFRVNTQPRDAEDRPIAWHLYNSYYTCSSGLPDETCIVLKDSDGVPNFNVCWVDTVFNDNGSSTWTYSVTELGVGKDLSHWNLKLDQSHQVLDWSPKAGQNFTTGVSVGVDGSSGLYSIKWDVNDNFQSGTFSVTLAGQYFGGTITAGVLAKGGNVPDSSDFFGPTTTQSTNGTPYNQVFSLSYDGAQGDVSGQVGPHDNGGVESAASFNQWFRDVPGVNMSRPLTISLQRQADGTYVFDDATDDYYSSLGGFFPIDGALFGNTANYGHNYHYTYEIQAHFTYDSQAGQFFEITSTDDVWVFIDGKLAIDLGGVHGSMTQAVDLDRMCLDCGERYRISIFIGDRHTFTHPRFRVRTNTEPESISVPAITAMFD